MVLIVIGIIIGLYALIDYKKAFIWFMVYQLFVSYGIQLVKVDSLSIPLGTILSFLFLILYILKNKKTQKNKNTKDNFPFKVAFILIIISRIMTCFTALGTFSEEFTRAISFIFQNIINIYIAWDVFDSKEDYIYFFKLVTIVFFFASILGYVEYALQYNPYTNYEKNFIGEGINYYSIEQVRGYRLTSIFEHPIGAGMNFALYFVISMYLLINKGKNMPFRKFSFITALMCLPLVFLTKQRSAMIFLILMTLSLVNIKKKSFYIFLIVSIITILLISPYISKYSYYLTSIFNETASEETSGSSIAMRLMQLNYSWELMKTSPLFGLGEKCTMYLSAYWIKRILVLESVWLEQMVKHGIFGIISYIVLAITFIFKIPKKYNIGKLKYVLIGFWIVYTTTTVPAFRLYLIYILIFYCIKLNKQNMIINK